MSFRVVPAELRHVPDIRACRQSDMAPDTSDIAALVRRGLSLVLLNMESDTVAYALCEAGSDTETLVVHEVRVHPSYRESLGQVMARHVADLAKSRGFARVLYATT